MVTEETLDKLNAPLDHARVKVFGDRAGSKSGLSYLEGHDVIREANTVFDFQWTRETSMPEMVFEAFDMPGQGGELTPLTDRNGNQQVMVAYKCRVIVRVMLDDELVERSGVGFGSSRMGIHSRADAHEVAVKEAETDATKRALMTLGDRFGLALYDKEQKNVSKPRDLLAEKKALIFAVQKAGNISAGQAMEFIGAKLFDHFGRPGRYEDLSEEDAAAFRASTIEAAKTSNLNVNA